MIVRRSPLGSLLALAAVAAVISGSVIALLGSGPAPSGGPLTAATSLPRSPPPPSRAPSRAPASASPPATPESTPGPTPPAAALPVLVGAIGDSLTVAVNASGQLGDQPEHSWIVGDAPDDGVLSHLERLRAFGADPAVVTAARPGAAIGSAPAQAAAVVATGRGLAAGETAYVTFELGANDVCAATLDDATPPDVFAAALAAAFETLSEGLPRGSTLVVLSVPDLTRLRTLLEDVPEARALHRRYGVCRSVLGERVAVDGARDRIRDYNAALASACEALAGSPIDCRHDQGGLPSGSLFGAVFELDELSALDRFHPSLAGQARIADETWPLSPWAGG